MKISTSLIRIRYAVGVMLALSAVFAVVIGTSTLQPRDATAQTTPVEVTISVSVDDDELREGSSDDTAVVTVTLSQTAAANVAVTLEAGTEASAATRQSGATLNDYAVDEETQSINNDSDLVVTIPQGSTSGSVTVTINDDTTGDPPAGTPEGTETITLSLSSTVPTATDAQTFVNDANDNSVEITVYDEENSPPAGTTVAISNVTPTVGNELTASFAAIASLTDADGKAMFESGPDGQTGTTVDNNSPVQYQWGHLVDQNTPATDGDTSDDTFVAISGATSMTYTVTPNDAGNVLAVRAGFADDSGFDNIDDDNYVRDGTVAEVSALTGSVTNSVTISVDKMQVTEGTDSSVIVTVTLSAMAPTGGATIPLAISQTGTASDDYSIGENASPNTTDVAVAEGTSSGTVTITINDDDTDHDTNPDTPDQGTAEGTETITVALGGTLPTGYANGMPDANDDGTPDGVSITIYDEENSTPTGPTTEIQDADGVAITAAPTVGQVLTAAADFGTTAASDADGATTFANGPDGETTTTPTDAVNDDNNSPVQYRWGYLVDENDPATPTDVEDDTFMAIGGATSMTYTVRAADAGRPLAVRVGFADDAGFDIGNGNYLRDSSNGEHSVDTLAVLSSINLSVDDMMLREGSSDNTAVVTVTLSAPAPTGGADIVLEIGTETSAAVRGAVDTIAEDYAIDETTTTIDNDSDLTVQIAAGETSGSVTVTINDDDTDHDSNADTPDQGVAEGTETITLSLGSTVPTGYAAGNNDSVEITVYDEENSPPGGPTAVIDNLTPTVGNVLTASAPFATTAATDADGPTTFANGPDGKAGTVTDNNSPVQYQWGHLVDQNTPATDGDTSDDTFVAISGETGNKYMVKPTDAGKILVVRVGFEDDADFDIGDGNYLRDSANGEHSVATAAVTNSINLSVDKTQVTEGTDSSVIVTVTLSATPAAGTPAAIAWTASTDSASADDYTVATTSPLTITNPYTTGTFQVNITDDETAEANETITITLGTAPTGYANGDADSVTITIVDDENTQPVGMPVINVGTSAAPAYVRPDTVLTADTSGISDADASGPLSFTYEWGTVDQDGAFTPISGATSMNYTVLATDAGSMIAVRVSFSDGTVNEVLTSAAVGAAVMVNFDRSQYTVDEGEPTDVTVSLSSAPADGETVEVVVSATGNMAGSFSMGDDEITLPYTLQFTGVNPDTNAETMQTITYTAPADVQGRQTVTLSLSVPTGHIAGATSPATIAINDAENSSPVDYSLTIDPVTPKVGDVVTATLSGLSDADGLSDPQRVTFVWLIGDDKRVSDPESESPSMDFTSTYTVVSADAGKTITVEVDYEDLAGKMNNIDATVPVATVGDPADVPSGTARISRIEPTIRGITTSAGDRVRLAVDVYGLQNVKDPSLASGVTFDWSVDRTGGTLPAAEMGNSSVLFTAPSSPGTYIVTAMLGASDCYDAKADAGEETAGCDAKFEVRVRRAAPAQPEPPAPVNPPGEIPSILSDGEGNNYEVFTPVEGGTFDSGEGYSINAEPGAVPNGEIIGVRMSDGGAASNIGMTHQRYTLGGNTYGVHAVDASGAAVSSYLLDDPATVCVPLPDMLRSNISNLALVTINGDGSLTILAASVHIGASGTSVCGNLSNLPASVAVGSQGAPDAIPTATPEPEPVLPDTGATAPSSNSALWALILGIAIVSLGTLTALSRRRNRSMSR